jgi:PmbA protein
MIEREALEIASDAVQRALRAGASEAEATVSQSRRFHVEARQKTLGKLEHSTGRTLSMRMFASGRRVNLASSDLTREGLERAIRGAVEQARYVTEDPLAALPEACGAYTGDLALYDEVLAKRENARKIDDAIAIEAMVRDADPRVVNSNGSHYSDGESITALVTSGGFSGAYAGTSATISSAPVAQEGEVKRVGHYGTAARRFSELDPIDRVASLAAKRAVELFGARKPPTARLPVIFERDVAAAVLADIFSALSAANVAIGNSWLAGRVGERIGSRLVNIVDDGTMPGKLGSSPFDGEGVPTRRTTVFTHGVLDTLLYDTYYARKLGASTTGNSTGGGIGATSLEALIASTRRGVLVLDTIGFATEHATGTYSRGARGFLIESGELSHPIDEFTIAGNFADMLAAIDGVADDLRFDGAIVSPSFRVGEMTISGN